MSLSVLMRCFVGLLLLAMSVACAPPSIKTTVLVPAKFDEAAKLKEVAVLPFDGRGGKELAVEIEGTLASINIHDKQYFKVVDRVRLDKAIEEMKLGQSALVDPNTAANVGKLVGAKGIYTGTITNAASQDSHYKEERSRCESEVTKKDKKGREYTECARWGKYNVSCTKRDASYAFTPKLIEVETGRVVYANNVSGATTASACEDSQKPLSSAGELIGQAQKFAKAMFRADVAPYYTQVEIKLIEDKDGISSRDAENKFEQGIEFAKKNRLDRACELWGEARTTASNSKAILYSLGMCAEVTGDPENALDLYKKADKLCLSPDDRISAAIHRISDAVQKKRKLKEQMGQ